VTKPTEEMRKAMFEAPVGDDVYGEDLTINALESKAAQIAGKEAGLFVTSGTMGNQLAILTHTQRGQEIILEKNSHIFLYEAGGAAFLSGVQTQALNSTNGILSSDDIKKAIREPNIHYPDTGLICIENTHNQCGGTVYPINVLKDIKTLSCQYGIPVHMDGARLFNAAAALNIPVTEITQYADSVMFCLSKGLSAPVGSILTGSKEFIQKARKYRKILGGGMRQAGVIAAAGLVALEKMVHRLPEDHRHAQLLAHELEKIHPIEINAGKVVTNILYFDIRLTGMNGFQFAQKLAEEGIKINGSSGTKIRMVTHRHISDKDIETVVRAVRKIVSKEF
jgi:threonine aldolase